MAMFIQPFWLAQPHRSSRNFFQRAIEARMAGDAREAQLIDRARRRDPDAVAELYRLYVPAISRYIRYRVSDDALVEDLTAEVFLRMVEALPRYQPSGVPFEAWLYRIAAARIADHYRRRKRRPQEELTDEMSEALPDKDSAETSLELGLQEQEEVDTLRQALRHLSDEHQTILILRFVERKSHEEVAELLGKNVQAIATAQHRALKKLAELLGAEKEGRYYLRGSRS